jgi:TetR/AcrR family transcriptional repressor of nem operon
MAASSPTPREVSKQETREALVQAAMEEFAEKGLDAPSLDAICARAGFTRGAFYVHFRDRTDLVAAVMERVLGAFLDATVASGEGARDLEATVNRFAAAIAALHQGGRLPDARRPEQGAVGGVPFHQVLAACQRSPEVQERFVSILEEAIRRVARAARSEGHDDAADVAVLLVLVALGVRVALDLDMHLDVAGVRDAALRLLSPAGGEGR